MNAVNAVATNILAMLNSLNTDKETSDDKKADFLSLFGSIQDENKDKKNKLGDGSELALIAACFPNLCTQTTDIDLIQNKNESDISVQSLISALVSRSGNSKDLKDLFLKLGLMSSTSNNSEELSSILNPANDTFDMSSLIDVINQKPNLLSEEQGKQLISDYLEITKLQESDADPLQTAINDEKIADLKQSIKDILQIALVNKALEVNSKTDSNESLENENAVLTETDNSSSPAAVSNKSNKNQDIQNITQNAVNQDVSIIKQDKTEAPASKRSQPSAGVTVTSVNTVKSKTLDFSNSENSFDNKDEDSKLGKADKSTDVSDDFTNSNINNTFQIENRSINTTKPDNVQSPEVKVYDQIVERLATTVKDGKEEISVKLKPDDLGQVEVKLTHTKEGLIAQIKTDQVKTQELLLLNMSQLSDSLSSKGIEVSKVDVVYDSGVQTQLGNGSAQDGQPQHHEANRYALKNENSDPEKLVNDFKYLSEYSSNTLDCLA